MKLLNCKLLTMHDEIEELLNSLSNRDRLWWGNVVLQYSDQISWNYKQISQLLELS